MPLQELDNLEVAKLITDYLGFKLNYNLRFSLIKARTFEYAIDGEFIMSAGWGPKYTVEDSLKSV